MPEYDVDDHTREALKYWKTDDIDEAYAKWCKVLNEELNKPRSK